MIRFILLLIGLVGSTPLFAKNTLQQADSLFAIGQYTVARDLYKSQLLKDEEKGKQWRPHVLLKMAYIEEVNGDYTQSLYYLSLLSNIAPSEAIYQKMEAIALKHRLSGYTFNDFSYFVLYIKKYGKWVYLFMIAVTGYVLVELFLKYRKNEAITFFPKLIIVLFLIALLVVINIGSLYKEAIVASSPTFMRDKPSSASAVLGTINKGNKVVVLGRKDHWKLVLVKGKLTYIRESDLLLI